MLTRETEEGTERMTSGETSLVVIDETKDDEKPKNPLLPVNPLNSKTLLLHNHHRLSPPVANQSTTNKRRAKKWMSSRKTTLA